MESQENSSQVLIVEQLLTTGGGWQDQVNGLLPGVKLGTTKPTEPLKVEFELLDLSPDFRKRLSSHLLVVYTGKVRLAKNLLQVKTINYKQVLLISHFCRT